MNSVQLKDLNDEVIYVDLKKESKEKLRQKIKDKFKTYSNFSRYLNLKVDKLSRNNDLLHFFEGYKIKLKFLKKIISPFPELNKDFIEKNVYRIGLSRGGGDIYNPKLPFSFDNKEGIRFISAILHDGSINSSFVPTYRNNERFLRRTIINCSKKILGEFKEREYGTLVIFPKIVGFILKKVGLKEGKKVFTDPKIPNFIFKSNIKNKALFLRQAFDDDGCISKIGYINIGAHIDVTKNKKISNLIIGIKKLLEEFDILVNEPFLAKEYKIKENIRQRWCINIYGRKNLEIFYNKIGFDIKRKRDRLKNILMNYKTNTYYKLKNQRYNESLKILSDNFKNKFFTIKQASNILSLEYHYTKQLIWKMENEGFIIRKTNEIDKNTEFFFK